MILRRRLLTIFAVIAVAYVVYALSNPDISPTTGNPSAPHDISAPATTPAKLADITLPSLDGSSKKLSAYKGKVVVLDFWAGWCNPCRMSVPDMNELVKEFAGKDLVVLAVGTDTTKAEVENGIKNFGIKYPVVWDRYGRIQDSFQIQSYPTVLIIDKQGNLKHRLVGYSSTQSPAELRKKVTEVLEK